MSCFLTPDTDKNVFTHPPELSEEIRELVGHYPVDVQGFRTDDKAWLRDEIFAMSRTQFQVVRHLLATEPWDYFHFVDIGQDRVHHGFWKYHDPQHVLHEPDSPFRETVHDYYRHIDAEIGRVLELLSDDTIVLVVSDHGAQRLDGGFCVNEWLVREGLLVLKSYPKEVTPFAKLDVDWEKTKVWSEGGYYARVFLNVKGREPQGVIDPADYESFRDEIKAKFEATVDRPGQATGNAGLQARGDLQERAERRPRPDRALRGSLLAVDRRSGLSDDPRPRERHRAGRLQPRPVRVVHPGGLEQSRFTARSPGPVCWTSHPRSWTWRDTRSRLRCRVGHWSRADRSQRCREPEITRPTMRRSSASD